MAPPDDPVAVERNLPIRMADGVRLAADCYRPAEGGRVPAIVTFIPYHKDGRGGRLDVEAVNRHFAARGYAALTVDFRGLGSSEGINRFPFDPQEARDGREVVEWVAAQPWCDGNVGMWGVSYGGITALAVAATRPPHLRAIVPIHAGADLYHDVIAPGGCRGGFWLGADWGPRMVAFNLTPPLWQDAEGRWARVWAEHLEGNDPWLFAWWDHPEFDEFWRSRVIPVERIACPTFNIGGWRDLYAEATVRDHAAIPAPKRILMGPWKHAFPDVALEGPAAGLAEMERWWERWLRGKENGVEGEPPVTLYVQGHGAGWRHERAWPPPTRPAEWHVQAGAGLAPGAPPPAAAAPPVAVDPTVGLGSLGWDPWTTLLDPTTPWDQSGDDARSLAFTSAPLPAPLELVGSPTARLDVTVSGVPGPLVARLADVADNGRSTLITLGWVPLRAAGRQHVAVPLRATAYRIPAGHRLRLAVAGADFPRLWPAPGAGTLAVHPGESRVVLPVGAADPGLSPPAWGPLQPAALRGPALVDGGQRWETRRDLGADAVTFDGTKEEHLELDPATRLHHRHQYQASVPARRADLARMQSSSETHVERPVGATRITVTTVTTTHEVVVTAAITLDGSPYWQRTWRRSWRGDPA
jgi:putative CocE/NonD family hydrolase